MTKEYYLGLDMGTSSVGWAVTDKDYNLLRAKGKDLWGVRLFKEANTAAERRGYRTSRRRLEREKARLGMLKQFFSAEINVLDNSFFQRLEDSKYHSEDKLVDTDFVLFADTGFTDKEYYEKYPTIFHLRKELIESKEKHDVRLVYLALANMYKHRGHFLSSTLDASGNMDCSVLVNDFVEYVLSSYQIECDSKAYFDVFNDYLVSKEYSNSRKHEMIVKALSLSKKTDKILIELLKGCCGLSMKMSVLFPDDLTDEDNKKMTLSFSDASSEEKMMELEDILPEEGYQLIDTMKMIYDWSILSNLMSSNGKNYQYLSEARVSSYEKHEHDLKLLKKLYKKYSMQEYNNMFRVMKENNYSAYVGSVNGIDKTRTRTAKVDVVKFFDGIKKTVSKMEHTIETEYVLSEIEKGTFLPKQLTSANGVIPNQLHKKEMIEILDNASLYLNFLNEVDETGLSVKEKIVKLFEFQIPYYIGTLNEKGKGWVKRLEKGPVFPWNFSEKIDEKQTAENFIQRMVNQCVYLNDEKVLPKNSLLYEKFMVLNELNNLKINQTPISVELKQKLYNELFSTGNKITLNALRKYLILNGYIGKDDQIDFSGIDNGFANTRKNYAKFTRIFEVEKLTYEQEQIAENLIYWITVYGDSKKFLKEKIKENYSEILSEKQIKSVLKLKLKDWGRFSKEFLQLEGMDQTTGEVCTIISKMWTENYILMQLLSHKFTYLKVLEEKTKKIEKTLSDFEYEDLDDLYVSAPVKRMIWQTILIVKELYQVLGCEPAKVFVEMARDKEPDKGRTKSRKQFFAELYKSCKEDGRNWIKEIEGHSERDFQSKKLYLYYTQMGRDMYTGKPISLDRLFTTDYDIDHIYPRHYVKDDSIINNLVLVNKADNAAKSDTFPISMDIQKAQGEYWRFLHEKGLISKEKYQRLTRKDEFSDDELAEFIQRQIVETRQGTKLIAELFKQCFEKTEVVYVKASNVSDFRHSRDMIKCRELNDLHHAQDAYLNVVVGNTYHVKFTKDPRNYVSEFRKNKFANKYHMDKIFNFDVIRGNETAWIAKDNQSIKIVKAMMKKATPLVTRMNYEEHGGLTRKVTVFSAETASSKNGVGYIPVKTKADRILDPVKYGGLTNVTGAYFYLVEHEEKGKRIRTIEDMPLYLVNELNSKEKIEKYCAEKLGYINPSVRLEKIKLYSLLKIDGYYGYITGRGDVRFLFSNAIQMVLKDADIKYLKKISKEGITFMNASEMKKLGISNDCNLAFYDMLISKYTSTIFAKYPYKTAEILMKHRGEFENLDIKKQIYVLLQILKLSGSTNSGCDLTAIDESKTSGRLKLSKKISNRSEVKLINRSITGLYESTVDLLTV